MRYVSTSLHNARSWWIFDRSETSELTINSSLLLQAGFSSASFTYDLPGSATGEVDLWSPVFSIWSLTFYLKSLVFDFWSLISWKLHLDLSSSHIFAFWFTNYLNIDLWPLSGVQTHRQVRHWHSGRVAVSCGRQLGVLFFFLFLLLSDYYLFTVVREKLVFFYSRNETGQRASL